MVSSADSVGFRSVRSRPRGRRECVVPLPRAWAEPRRRARAPRAEAAEFTTSVMNSHCSLRVFPNILSGPGPRPTSRAFPHEGRCPGPRAGLGFTPQTGFGLSPPRPSPDSPWAVGPAATRALPRALGGGVSRCWASVGPGAYLPTRWRGRCSSGSLRRVWCVDAVALGPIPHSRTRHSHSGSHSFTPFRKYL